MFRAEIDHMLFFYSFDLEAHTNVDLAVISTLVKHCGFRMIKFDNINMKLDLDQFSEGSASSESLQFENFENESNNNQKQEG